MSRTVSIVIPTFNRAHLLRRTVENVLDQTHRELQVIVVDDGSRDRTSEVMAACFGGNDRVLYVPQDNAGVSAARNHALRLVRGDFVAYLDSDDQWVPWKLEAELAVLSALPEVGMVWTDMDEVDERDRLGRSQFMRQHYSTYSVLPMHLILPEAAAFSTLARGMVGPAPRTQVRWGDAFSAMALGNLCLPSTVLMTKQRVDEVGPWNEAMRAGEDHEYHLRCARVGQVALLDCATVRYRKGADDQLTRPDLKLTIAENYLKTIEPVFETERARIRLPSRLMRQTLAAAHAWIGEELTKHGRSTEARAHFVRSLRSWPLQRRTFMMLALSLAPDDLASRARVAYRSMKSTVTLRS